MAETTDLRLKLGADTTDGQQAIAQFARAVEQFAKVTEQAGKKTEQSFKVAGESLKGTAIDIDAKLNLARRAFDVVTQGASQFFSLIREGGQEIAANRSFEAMTRQFGALASDVMPKLQAATRGLIEETDLQRAANEAMLAGLRPERFVEAAGAASTLAKVVGLDTVDAIDKMSKALITGNDRLVKQLVGVIDNKKAMEDYARSLGFTGDEVAKVAKLFNEEERAQANRNAIIEAATKKAAEYKDRLKELGNTGETAAEALKRLETRLGDARGNFLAAIASSEELRDLLSQVADVADNFKGTAFINFLNLAFGAASDVVAGLRELKEIASNLPGVGGGGDELAGLVERREKIARDLDKLRLAESGKGSLFSFGFGELPHDAAEKWKRELQILDAQITEQAEKSSGKIREAYGPPKEAFAQYTKEQEQATEASRRAADLRARLADAEKDKQEKLTEEVRKQTHAYDELVSKLNARDAGDALKEAFEGLDADGFATALAEFQQKLADSTILDLKEKFKLLNLSDEQLKTLANQINSPEIQKKQDEFAEHQKEAFQKSVDFFGDVLTSTITGSAQDMEDIFKNALQRVAVGFGSQLLATIAESLGLTAALGDIGSASGLGQALAKAIFGGGAVFGDSAALAATGLFGSGVPVPIDPGFIGPVLPGSAAATTVPATGLAGSLAALGPLGAVLALLVGGGAGAGLLAEGIKNQDLLSGSLGGSILGSTLNLGIGTTLGLFTGGVLSSGVFDDVFGGDSQKAKEREAREALLDQIFGGDATFSGVGGRRTISASNFNTPDSPFAGRAVGLVDPFADILSGGDDKLGSDLAGIFATAVTEADNFNEVLVNTMGLMDRLGFSVDEAKNQLSELFLDGKIGLDEFSAGMSNLATLSKDSLVGSDGVEASLETVADAIDIVAENIETNPRVALRGLALAFKEMEEQGVTSTEEIHAYMAANFPEMVELFDKLAAAGFDTFDEIAKAGPDAINQIFGVLGPYRDELAAIVGYNGDLQTQADVARDIGDGWRYAAEQKKKYAEIRVQDAPTGAGSGGSGSAGSSGSSGTTGIVTGQPNNPRTGGPTTYYGGLSGK